MPKHSYPHVAIAPEADAPLIFTFHGTGGDEYQFPELVRRLRPGAGIISPRGDVSEHGAARFFRRTGEGVYDMDDLALRTRRMKAFIAAHRQDYPETQIHALGYSNGANILASVLFEAPELFDRVALLHPLIPWTPEPNPALEALPVLITAGERDPICPLPVTQSLVTWLQGQGAAVELVVHPGGHEVRNEELAALGAFLA